MSKNLVQFELEDGSPVLIEVEEPTAKSSQKVSITPQGIAQAQVRFAEAIAQIRPAAEVVLDAFRQMNHPSEVNLEFGIKLSGKLGAIFTAVESEATFKVVLKWKNESHS